jgi:hypothetical protein
VPSLPQACDDARWMARSNGSELLEKSISRHLNFDSTSQFRGAVRPSVPPLN